MGPDSGGRRAGFWQLDDLDVVAANLLEAVNGGRTYRAWGFEHQVDAVIADPPWIW